MNFLYQSSYICVDKYCLVYIINWGSASITFHVLMSPKKLCSQNKHIFYFLSYMSQLSNTFKSLRITCSNLSADNSTRPSFHFGAIQELHSHIHKTCSFPSKLFVICFFQCLGNNSYKGLYCAQSLSHVWLFVTPWVVAHRTPLSMGFPRQEEWSGLLFPSPGESSQSRDENHVSYVSYVGWQVLDH